jgi:hypothetical protein
MHRHLHFFLLLPMVLLRPAFARHSLSAVLALLFMACSSSLAAAEPSVVVRITRYSPLVGGFPAEWQAVVVDEKGGTQFSSGRETTAGFASSDATPARRQQAGELVPLLKRSALGSTRRGESGEGVSEAFPEHWVFVLLEGSPAASSFWSGDRARIPEAILRLAESLLVSLPAPSREGTTALLATPLSPAEERDSVRLGLITALPPDGWSDSLRAVFATPLRLIPSLPIEHPIALDSSRPLHDVRVQGRLYRLQFFSPPSAPPSTP